MSFRKFYTSGLIAFTVLALASCKDDEDTTVSPSLDGTLSFKVDHFVLPKAKVTIVPEGLTHPDDKGIGYYWKVTPDMEKADTTRLENGLSPEGEETDGRFEYTFPEELQTYTVYCTAFAEGYANGYASKYVTVVKPGLDGSITGTGIKKDGEHITEAGVDYYFKEYNGIDWMLNNLAAETSGAAYINEDILSNVYGRFYSYEEALKACPAGWRLPTDKEWVELANAVNGKTAEEHKTISAIAADFMGDVQFNGETMWEYWPEVGNITNKSGMSMLPAGYANLGEKDEDGVYKTASFNGFLEYAVFWTADKVEGMEGMAYYRYLTFNQPDMKVGEGDIKTFGANVRCVRD